LFAQRLLEYGFDDSSGESKLVSATRFHPARQRFWMEKGRSCVPELIIA
jgi:hypothetical protein